MKVVAANVVPYQLPFIDPLTSAAGSFETRDGFLLRLSETTGRSGYGDAAPWPGFGTDSKAVQRTLATLERSDGPLCGSSFRNVEDVRQWLQMRPLPPETSHAVELALLDLLAQTQLCSVSDLLCEEPRTVVELHALVATTPAAEQAVRGGARCLKIKLGASSVDDDVQRVAAIRRQVGPDVALRVDAGGSWDVATAVAAAKQLGASGIEWLEQPVAARDLEGMAQVRREAGVPVAVDEGVQRLADVERVVELGAADVLVIKPMFAGGLLAALQMAELGHSRGLKVVVTHALESAVGRVGALHLAAAINGPLPACGLANPLREDVVPRPPVATGGWAKVPAGIGLGVDARQWFKHGQSEPKSPLEASR